MYYPSDEEVNRVMQETGMDRLQAYRHLQQRMKYVTGLRRITSPFPLGKSAY